MLEYLEKFKKLPEDVRKKISSTKTLEALNLLEKKYDLKLATLIIRIALKEITIERVQNALKNEFFLKDERAIALENELREKVLVSIWDYLNPASSRVVINTNKIPVTKENKAVKETKEDKTGRQIALPKKKIIPKLESGREVDLSHLLPTSTKDKNKKINVVDFSSRKDRRQKTLKKEKSSENINSTEDNVNFFKKDQKEINEIIKTIPKENKTKNNKEGGRSKEIDDIVRQAKISFSSQVLEDRFKQIVFTYFLGVRNKIATIEVIKKSVKDGGLGLNEVGVNKVMLLLTAKKEKRKEKLKDKESEVKIKTDTSGSKFILNNNSFVNKSKSEKTKESVNTKVSLASGEIDYDLASVLKEGKIKKISPSMPKDKEPLITKTKSELIPDLTTSSVNKKNSISAKFNKSSILNSDTKNVVKDSLDSLVPEKVPEKIKETPTPEKAPEKIKETPTPEKAPEKIKKEINEQSFEKKEEITQVRRGDLETGKKKMDDIKTPQIMTPIDEIAYMDLVSFRRIDMDIDARMVKIKNKIDLLADQGIDKLIAGIKAWRSNIIYKTYLEMGNDSMGEKKSVDDIIKIRKEKGLNCLEKDEFEAVMDLNKKLKF